LVHLKGITSLKDLFLTGTQVSDAGEAALRTALPHTKIYR